MKEITTQLKRIPTVHVPCDGLLRRLRERVEQKGRKRMPTNELAKEWQRDPSPGKGFPPSYRYAPPSKPPKEYQWLDTYMHGRRGVHAWEVKATDEEKPTSTSWCGFLTIPSRELRYVYGKRLEKACGACTRILGAP